MSTNHARIFDAKLRMDTPTAVRAYRLAILDEIINHFKRHPTALWPAIRHIEWTPRFLLHRRRIAGTVFEPCVDVLKRCGTEVDDGLGSIMCTLGFSSKDLHYLACACNGHGISGDTMSRRLNFIANYHLRYT